MKYIFVTGGVISGIGKGIVTSSLALLLKDLGLRVAPVKVDMYLNLDAGTLRPQEHGETFVLADGLETDQDMGNYERFLGEDLKRDNYITTGQIYNEVLRKERAFEYDGTTVEAIPHLTDEVARRIRTAGEKMKADVVLVELGGTITLQEIQNRVFIEAARIMDLKNPGDVLHAHVTYLPFVKSIGELKSKPAQTSVYILNSMGIQPDLVFARSEIPMDQKRADKVALFCNIPAENLILSPDVTSIYEIPLLYEKQKLSEKVCQKLNIKKCKQNGVLKEWNKMFENSKNTDKEVTVAMVAKYIKSGDYDLTDSYLSVVEALKHAGNFLKTKVKIKWVDSEKEIDLTDIDGLIVPQGWGSRGVEGKIKAVQYAREKKVPYLGLCFGMQMAVIEFARNICHLSLANSEEVNPKTKYPVIHLMKDQEKYLAKKQFGGTIRLGQWPAIIDKKSKLFELYKIEKVLERHRHRYEFNNKYRKILEKNGLKVSATSPDGKLVEAIELPDHPFFIGTQYHPELQSRPLTPHPLFIGFLEACLKNESKDKKI
ncbi:MAG: CTP synthase [bacterium]|nr:CTP synthase [bacterium]